MVLVLVPGYWNFPNACEIPEDLLMQFSDFVDRYNITNALPVMFSTTGLGMGSILNRMTLPVMQAFGAQMARLLLGRQASFAPSSGRNQDLHDAIARFLGDKVLYNTRAVRSTRSDDGVNVTVRNTVSGRETIINAKKLLIAIEPVAAKLAAFDLDEHEHEHECSAGFSSPASIPASSRIPRSRQITAYPTCRTLPMITITRHTRISTSPPVLAAWTTIQNSSV